MSDQPVDAPALPLGPLPWQQPLWDKLNALLAQQRLPHALLLSGVPGVGKRHLATAFARRLFCSGGGTLPCGRCKGCLLMAQGTHPDLVRVEPEEPGKPIKIDQIRQLNRVIAGSAQQGGYRVLILHPAEEMNVNAANALLKGLEEPGERTLFLLISQHPGRLLPTIRSRCQAYPLGLPEPAQALDWLHAQLPGNGEASVLLELAAGAPLLAREMAANGQLSLCREWLRGLAQVASGKQNAVDQAERWYRKADVDGLLGYWLALMADLVRFALSDDPEQVRNPDARGLVPKLAARAGRESLFAFTDKMQEYRLQLIGKSNPNKQLLLEDLLISWSQLFRHS